MIELVDLPTRRVEAWKHSDLRKAIDADTQFALKRGRDAPEVVQGLDRGGVIGALAAQMDAVQTLRIPAGETHMRIDRPSGEGNLAPRLLDVEIAPGGTLTRIVVQAEAQGVVLDAAHVRVGAGATFRQFVLAEGAKLARIETHVNISGEGATVELNGAYLCASGRHADLTSVVRHKAAGGTTRQLIKGVARKGGRGVFQGKIVVEAGAQKTDARQYHHGMLLEAAAEIFAKPELMIHADDVQCAHGNTAGGLDESALFYLRSRGVGEAQARALLIEVFLTEAIPVEVPVEVREDLSVRIRAWLARSPA